MKNSFLRSLFVFILDPLEKGDGDFKKNPLGRKILIVIGLLFFGLGSGVVFIYFKVGLQDIAYLIPSLVFLSVGVLCLIVGCLGNDRAVSKVWGNR